MNLGDSRNLLLILFLIWCNYEKTGKKENGFELNALFGGEFFFTGLDSLAFTFEGGVGIVSTSDVRFRTIANSPLKAGILF